MNDKLELQTKECVTCKSRKLLSEFSKRKDNKTGYHGVCKKCVNVKRQEYRKKNPDMVKDESLRLTFGITIEQYKEMLEKQHGVCAICKHPETSTYKGKLRHLSVDHCHETGKVRGLLCNDCNVALGWMKDDTARLRSAADYLDLYKM